ncbi:hypothetical protein PPL_08354 [Heterostelium album PN500]|uniref:Uncharacterized protein n=1 Tax=Heterostelium pallidum (strain ATCC 26659 / Pp 5 / PN500) TaxID=670386 RepID=D3BHY6_HETP5|nr:hypothetical protein PPL_08354 [Heterostelium album PN500]EFA78886.1 hypothetical protein PPL_08354 [Heterostelium album PN500]|eukprot:XP_020431010.1 hypothetical protein PPL_08354 [Heterostelium album PN500]
MIEDLTNNLNNFDTTILKLITLYNSQFKSIKIDYSKEVIDRSDKYEIVFKDSDLELIKEILQQSVVVSLKNENTSTPTEKSVESSSLSTSTVNPPQKQTTTATSGMLYYYAEDCLDSGQDIKYVSTHGVDFKIRSVELDGKIIKQQIWEVGGMSKIHLRPSYTNGNTGILLVYNVADGIKDWLALLNNNKHTGSKILVGNKCDLQKRVIDYERGRAMADDLGIPFIETSAVTGTGIKEAFTLLAKSTLKRFAEETISKLPKAPANDKGGLFSFFNKK